MAGDPKILAAGARRLAELAGEAGRPTPGIATFARFDPKRPGAVSEQVGTLREAGVTHVIAGARYDEAEEFEDHVAFLAESVRPGLD
jgi:hypothetical protein